MKTHAPVWHQGFQSLLLIIKQAFQNLTCKTSAVNASTANIPICSAHAGKYKFTYMDVFRDFDRSCQFLILAALWTNVPSLFQAHITNKAKKNVHKQVKENFLEGKLLPAAA